MVVAPEVRRRGIASALLQACARLGGGHWALHALHCWLLCHAEAAMVDIARAPQ